MNETPTKEALKQGEYEFMRVEKNGAKVWVNRGITPIDRAYNRKKLTYRQYEAGKTYERRYTAYWERSSGRNILDVTPRGRSASDESLQERALKNKENLEEIEHCYGLNALHRATLVSICVDHAAIGDCRPERKRYSTLIEALDLIADYLKIR